MNQLTNTKHAVWLPLFFLLVFLKPDPLTAQIKPDIFPEDIGTPGGGIVRCFCKPGVRNKSRSKGIELSYITRGSGEFEDQRNSLSKPFTEYKNWTKLEVDLKAPVINTEGFKFLVGYKYTAENFNIKRLGIDFPSAFQRLGDVSLKSGNISAIVTKPLNEKQYLAFRFRYSANGNYDGILSFDSRYAIYKGMAVFGVKKHHDFEWGVGLNFSKSFRRTNILPFLVYNKTFINDWGLEAAFPGYIYARYNLSAQTIFLFGTEYASDSYRLDVPESPVNDYLDYAFNHSELLFLARWEQQIAPWIWINMRVGYQLNFSSDFESKAIGTEGFLFDSTDTPFFEIGIFISPPDGVLK